MAIVYRFRVLFEEYEDVYRDIEVKANQTFEDLHHAIQKAIGFDASQMASFYMSDDYWRKGLEITLMDMSDGDEDQEPKVMMKNSKLRDFIDDPHQKIIYIFDFMALWTFYIELTKILPAEEAKADYPRCIKSGGVAPKQYKGNIKPPSEDDDEEGGKKKTSAAAIFDEFEGEFEEGEEEESEDSFGFDDEHLPEGEEGPEFQKGSAFDE